eukprot:scaffold4279_cov99-Isochrysis_galbana.AAC.14
MSSALPSPRHIHDIRGRGAKLNSYSHTCVRVRVRVRATPIWRLLPSRVRPCIISHLSAHKASKQQDAALPHPRAQSRVTPPSKRQHGSVNALPSSHNLPSVSITSQTSKTGHGTP